ncbi:ATP-dependent RNA helicase HrpA [Idiomarina xiamenensis]|uniref:RNA helicase n=1 Tax=Idiomarina xiamenensis 10-D-4 TaxID=740709 RepID=K2JTZ8_9GAMM|nr:ATP-dependent RNA helicase HrpA [Idiomarina xiamenensis]EKE86921.1 helicase, ATP-dependent [Idiomarina xiamenensis 10-D-4]
MSVSATPESLASRFAELTHCMIADAAQLRRRLRGLTKIKQAQRQQQVLAQIDSDIEQAKARLATRLAQSHHIDYPPQLPVAEQQQRIKDAIAKHQVVVVAGETGSGKTTQLPKMLLELGYGRRGFIGHTQPRRLAARSVASRIAEELRVPLGSSVGYKVRFNDQTEANTAIKLMTDGVLLAELQQDRLLRAYDAIIIDEAHERSLNIDFLLGVLHQLLPKRPDLKVVITSATIETERFAEHFQQAPIIEVSGRAYPVEVRYQALQQGQRQAPRDVLDAVAEAVLELQDEGPGDILLFASGEREIRDFADAITQLALKNTEVLPLYARLSATEQNRIFQSHSQRRVVIATNVAETSLTVPGIRYVIDPGTARISRYSYRSKVQRLPIEPISQASANQRKGRCGRVGPGICIRLYSEDDFNSRPAFTDPEILRTNLAAVILQMTALELGDIRQFPFLQKPDERFVKDGFNLLEELNALASARYGETAKLTPLGQQLSRLPLDPRLARMVLAAQQHGCVREVMVIVAALSIQDPRERPSDKQQKADQLHQRFHDKDSDFISYLKLWDYLAEQQKSLSKTQLRRLCQREFIHFLRVREWQDVYTQTRQTVRELGIQINSEAASYEAIHRALISGLLSYVGQKDERHEYLGARQRKFFVFPGSNLFKKPPKWLVSAELVETSRLFARTNARIDPGWVEAAAQHLVKRQYLDPRFEKKQGSVVADEQVSLLGLVLVPRRRVQFGPISPVVAREIFIREGLVSGELKRPLPFIEHNQALIAEVESLEEKSRRRDILVDEEALFNAYDAELPAGIYNEQLLAGWWHKAAKKQPQLLYFTLQQLKQQDAEHVTDEAYPAFWQQGNLRLPLHYRFEPSAEDDGVTLQIPLALLNQVSSEGTEWLIPALREELVTALIKALPKAQRRQLVPAPDYARAIVADLQPLQQPLLAALSYKVKRMTGMDIDPQDWPLAQLPAHLRMNFCIVDEKQQCIAQGRDLDALQQRLRGKVKQTLVKRSDNSGAAIRREAITDWQMGALPVTLSQQQGPYQLQAFPALRDNGKQVAVDVFESQQRAAFEHRKGLRKLVLLQVPSPVRYLQKSLSNKAKLAMYFNPWGKVESLVNDCIDAAVDELLQDADQVRDQQRFQEVVTRVREQLNETVEQVAAHVEQILLLGHQIKKQQKGQVPLDQIQSRGDIQAQLDGLIYAGFVSDIGVKRLPHIVRYLKAIQRRLEKLPVDPQRDRLQLMVLERLQQEYQQLLQRQPKAEPLPDAVKEVRWMLEELRVSLFAQQLGTQYPISEKRVKQALADAS